jgi:hypothetical protein
MTLDVFRLGSNHWVALGVFGGSNKVRLESFQQISPLAIFGWWIDGSTTDYWT